MEDVDDIINFLWRHSKCRHKQLIPDEIFYRIVISLVAEKTMEPTPTGLTAAYHQLFDDVILMPQPLALHRHSRPELLNLLDALIFTCHALTAV